MKLPSRPIVPKYAKAHFTWFAMGSMLVIQSLLGFLVPVLLFSGHHTAMYVLVTLGLTLMLSPVIPIFKRGRTLKHRLRETNCQLCPDCGYDLRDHADANPCPECGRPWNKAEDTKWWRTTYAARLKYPKK